MNRRDLALIDQARRRASTIVSLLDVVTPAEAVQAIKGPALSLPARQAAAVLARRIRRDVEGLALVLTGEVDDALLECFTVEEAPPDEITLEALLFGFQVAPTATTRTVSDLDYMRGAGIDPNVAPGAKTEPPGDRP